MTFEFSDEMIYILLIFYKNIYHLHNNIIIISFLKYLNFNPLFINLE